MYHTRKYMFWIINTLSIFIVWPNGKQIENIIMGTLSANIEATTLF